MCFSVFDFIASIITSNEYIKSNGSYGSITLWKIYINFWINKRNKGKKILIRNWKCKYQKDDWRGKLEINIHNIDDKWNSNIRWRRQLLRSN